MMSNPKLALAVAGSGAAVAQLGAVARQAGNPVSLHGTGGAWIIAGANRAPDDFELAAFHSVDRKVCNTLNTCVVTAIVPPLSSRGSLLLFVPWVTAWEPTPSSA